MHYDICCSFPLQDMLKYHQKQGGLFTMMSVEAERDQAKKLGQVVFDRDT